jgi:hypothetical protein
MSDWYSLHHNDNLQIGATKLALHIHPGTETCDQCEPGQVLSAAKDQKIQGIMGKLDIGGHSNYYYIHYMDTAWDPSGSP